MTETCAKRQIICVDPQCHRHFETVRLEGTGGLISNKSKDDLLILRFLCPVEECSQKGIAARPQENFSAGFSRGKRLL